MDYRQSLYWQQGGSPTPLNFADAQKYVEKLNADNYGGNNDWRLPTLKEAMSLMEPEEKDGGLYIDPVFDKSQWWIWTVDKFSTKLAWVVFFDSGFCFNDQVITVDGYPSVRAVRS